MYVLCMLMFNLVYSIYDILLVYNTLANYLYTLRPYPRGRFAVWLAWRTIDKGNHILTIIIAITTIIYSIIIVFINTIHT